MRKTVSILIPALVALVLASGPAGAAEEAPLVVTFDKVQVVHLASAAQKVIVANPAIADVSVEEPTLLYVFGKAPGETSITVLGSDNRELLSRPVVVTTEPDRLVTVFGPTSEGPNARNYSCVTNRCLRVASPEAVAATAVAPVAAAAGGLSGSSPIPGSTATPVR